MTHQKVTGRYREIAGILTRQGFGWLWARWEIGTVLGKIEHRLSGESASTETQPVRLRLTLEELGTTFIKVGQVLSTRPDLLPADFIVELSKLQDHVPTVPYAEIVEAVNRELGAPPEALFASFDPVPRAAASIAQVHNAVLPDGTRVVVKVKRPGIELQIEQDLTIVGQLARFLEHNADFGKQHSLERLVEEFAYSLRNELDLIREGQNAERIAKQFAEDPSLHVPKIFWEFSSRGVLTMEEINGVKIDDLAGLDAAGIDRKALAKNCANLALRQVLEFGFFHADPHPGNFFVAENGVIGLIDYGMVGRLDDRLRASLLRIAVGVSRHDGEQVVDELLAMGAARGSVDRTRLSRDLDRILNKYSGTSIGEMSIGQIFRDITSTAQRHGLSLPSDLVLVVRLFAMDEGMGSHLDPEFNMLEFARPYFVRFWKESHSPEATARRLKESVFDLADIGLELPQRLLRLMGTVERGELQVVTKVEIEHPLLKDLQRAINRVAISVLTAGLIVGLSVLALVYSPTGASEFAFLVPKILLFVGMVSGIWLLISFWKSSR